MLQAEFPEVTPTAKELYSGKIYAYQAAARRMDEEKRKQREQQRREQMTRMWTFEEMKERAIAQGKAIAIAEGFKNGFILDSSNSEVFDLLCLYFTNDPRFEQHGLNGIKYSLKKGIWLQSIERGTGKSTLLKCFRFNKRCCFGYQHSTELANKFQKNGFGAIDFFMSTIPQPPSPMNFYQSEAGFMYDELFGEIKVNHMGTPLLVSEYIINSLYDFSTNKKGQLWKFHCTSNATGADIEQVSGLTFRSRMPDMFNLIKLDGPNRRVL